MNRYYCDVLYDKKYYSTLKKFFEELLVGNMEIKKADISIFTGDINISAFEDMRVTSQILGLMADG